MFSYKIDSVVPFLVLFIINFHIKRLKFIAKQHQANYKMGNKISATKKTKTQKAQTQVNRTAAIQMRKQEIEQVQTGMMKNAIQQIRNGSTDEQAMVTMGHFQQVNEIAETSKQQLDREGKALTKSDLIAILVALEPSHASNAHTLSTYSVMDLNALIRIVVYDPSRYIATAQPQNDLSQNGKKNASNQPQIKA